MHSVHPTPKFSIITVTYNAEKVLEDTIQSVISQTYHHIEYIIVDGASKDGTLSIINRYRPHIHTVVSEPDKNFVCSCKLHIFRLYINLISCLITKIITINKICI